jgi:hypothetical protein
MATITSAASGNWSDTATWVGGVVPTAADDVIIGAGHTVAANVDITVLTISGAANITSNLAVTTNRTITCTGANGITAKSVNNGLGLVRISSPGIIVNINSNIRGVLSGGNSGVDITASCTVNIVGTLSHIANTGTASSSALNIGAAATVNVTGNLFGAVGSVGASSAIYPNAGCILNITGNLSAGDSNNSAVYNITSACTINITGIFGVGDLNFAQKNKFFFKNSEEYFNNTLSLPIFYNFSFKMQVFVIKILKKYCKKIYN